MDDNKPPALGKIPPLVESFLNRGLTELNRFEGDPQFYVEKIYRLVDVIYKHQIKPVAACPSKGGCSACCYVPVQVTALEADYIHKKTGIEPKELTAPKIAKPTSNKSAPCPFLKLGNCSIYEFRPLACRVFASMDTIEQCNDPTEAHWIATINSSGIFKHLHDKLIKASHDTPYAAFADVRHWFSPEEIKIKNIKD